MLPRPDRRPTPRQRARIAELRRSVPWLGLRRIARALDLSLHEVRQALVERLPPERLQGGDKRPRCVQCGAKLIVEPCLACAAQESLERRKERGARGEG